MPRAREVACVSCRPEPTCADPRQGGSGRRARRATAASARVRDPGRFRRAQEPRQVRRACTCGHCAYDIGGGRLGRARGKRIQVAWLSAPRCVAPDSREARLRGVRIPHDRRQEVCRGCRQGAQSCMLVPQLESAPHDRHWRDGAGRCCGVRLDVRRVVAGGPRDSCAGTPTHGTRLRAAVCRLDAPPE